MRINSLSDLQTEFNNYNRSNNFNPLGLEWILETLESTDSDVELDVIALCCDFTQYDDLIELEEQGLDSSDFTELSDGSYIGYNQ
jgi:hypothetical protein